MAVIQKRLPKANEGESLRYFLIASLILHLLLLLIIPKRDLTSLTDPPSPWEEGAISISFQPLDQPVVDPGISIAPGEQTIVETEEPVVDPAEAAVPVTAQGPVDVPVDSFQPATAPNADRSDIIQPQNLPAPALQPATVGEVMPDGIPAPQALPQPPLIQAQVNEVNPDAPPVPQVLPQAPLLPAQMNEVNPDMPPAPQVLPQPPVAVEPEAQLPLTEAPVRPEIEPEAPPAPQVLPQELAAPERPETNRLEEIAAPTAQAPERPQFQPAERPDVTPPDLAQAAPSPDAPALPVSQAPDRSQSMQQAPDRPETIQAPEAPERPQGIQGSEPSERPQGIQAPEMMERQPPANAAPVRTEPNPESVVPSERPDPTPPAADRPEPQEAPNLPEMESPVDLPVTRPTIQPPPTYGASLHFPSIGLDPPKDMVALVPTTVSVLITFDEHGAFVGNPELLPVSEPVDPSILRDAPLYVRYNVRINQPAPAGYVCQAIVHVTFDPTAPAGSGVRFWYDDEYERVSCYPV